MAVKLGQGQLHDVLTSLNPHRKAIVLTGELQEKLYSSLPDWECFVDQWADFNVLIMENEDTASQLNIMIHTKDISMTKRFIERHVDWSRKVKFVAIDSRFQDSIVDVASRHKETVKVTGELLILTVTSETLDLSQVPSDVTLSSLLPQQSEMVNSNWKRKGEGTADYIRNLIEKFPSCCLYVKGKVAAYVLAYHHGCIGILYVMEEHRGKGYGKVVVSQLVSKCLLVSDSVYVVVEASNFVSLRLHQRVGFSVMDDFTVKWITAK